MGVPWTHGHGTARPTARSKTLEPFGWNYKQTEKHGWLIFFERKILFRLKK
jgi:hypothetical protein